MVWEYVTETFKRCDINYWKQKISRLVCKMQVVRVQGNSVFIFLCDYISDGKKNLTCTKHVLPKWRRAVAVTDQVRD